MESNVNKLEEMRAELSEIFEKINLRRRPYCGAVTDLARKLGVSHQAILQRVKKNDVRTMRLLMNELESRAKLEIETVSKANAAA